MKTLRTLGIIVAVALAAIGLAVLPSVDEAPQARPGISVGETSAAEHRSAPAPGAETVDPGESVPLPAPTAAEQPVRGIHAETGLGTMEPEPSSAPAPAPKPAPEQPRASGPSSSSSSSAGSSSGTSESTPPRPAGVCEWDDGELECEDDDDDDDDVDDDD